MIINLPNIQLPDSICQLCTQDFKNTKKSYAIIADIIQADPFLNILVNNCFQDFLQKGGLVGMLSSLGCKGFRDRVAQAYLSYVRIGGFPAKIILDDVNEVLDFERRFESIFVQDSSRVFLLGFYIKMCNQSLIRLYGEGESETLNIPDDFETIFTINNIKSESPDWLIFVVWTFTQIFGVDKSRELLVRNHGRYHRIIPEFQKNEHDQFIEALLKYGHAINDKSFFLYEKV